MRRPAVPVSTALFLALLLPLLSLGPPARPAEAQEVNKPVLHARHWMAITGKPLAASAGARIFNQGGNAVDAACAMLAATSTMWDVLGWGGETQALIFNPDTGEVIGINALGAAPTGATPEFFKERGMEYPPAYGPLAAVTPGTPGGLLTMLAEFGTLSAAEVLAPAIEMAVGYPMEEGTARRIEGAKERIKQWDYSREVFLPHAGEEHEAPRPGELFRQPYLEATLRKLVEAEAAALEEGKSRKEAIEAAYDRFYRGDIAAELVRATQEAGGLITMEDLDTWQVYLEDPVSTTYRGVEVVKLTHWVQGPVMLQMLDILEEFDLREMGYNSARYIHTVTQAMNLAFADRDFYYGDPYFPPSEPIEGLLDPAYAGQRAALIDPERARGEIGPGDPYPHMGEENPYSEWLRPWPPPSGEEGMESGLLPQDDPLTMGTTSIQAADGEGWVVSVTPSGGWIPAFIAGETGVGLSQRMQSFVLNERENPFNVVAPGKRPRATLTPGMALQDGLPFLSFAVQGGDNQDQDLLQFFLNMVEFDMGVQEACEAANFHTSQLLGSFGDHPYRERGLQINQAVPPWVRERLRGLGYRLSYGDRTSGPINAIFFDRVHGTMWGGSSDHGDDYGIGW
ncbi:MAG: gamma-glutamyltransferase [bacterium]